MNTTTKETMISEDLANNKLLVVREFDAPLEQVWKAWTESDLLDQWWAPKPWKAKTQSMDFSEGGTWFYCMEGPEGEKQYCRADYQKIVPQSTFTGVDAFCDEDGIESGEMPSMHWKCEFSEAGSGTQVRVELSFATREDMNKIVEMGFKEGFTAAHANLDELLAK